VSNVFISIVLVGAGPGGGVLELHPKFHITINKIIIPNATRIITTIVIMPLGLVNDDISIYTFNNRREIS
jgi:hypothetical protein